MKTILNPLFLVSFLAIVSSTSIFSQQSYGGYPYGLSEEFSSLKLKSLGTAVELSTLSASEIKEREAISSGKSPLFAYSKEPLQGLLGRGSWTRISKAEWLWQLQINVPNSKGLMITLRDLELPQNARLFMYNEGGQQVLGSYTKQSVNAANTLKLGLIQGEQVYLEYIVESSTKPSLPFKLDKIYHVADEQQAFGSAVFDTGFDSSWPCHDNINCGDGLHWQDASRGVMRILMVLEEGLGYCTGSLMNTTAEEKEGYILSAYHCQDGYTPIWDQYEFGFNYEAPSCETPASEPAKQLLQGCEFVAGRRQTDFILLKLIQDIPENYNVFYNGWDRRDNYSPEPALLIHHPNGDMKKGAFERENLVILDQNINWDNDLTTPRKHHFSSDLENGSHQPGSSGGPLLDSARRIIGQLHGGISDEQCIERRAYFGRLSISWNGGSTPETRLSDWLDPLGTGAEQLDGLNQNESSQSQIVTGVIKTADDRPISNAKITLSDADGTTVFTDSNGSFTIPNVIMNDDLMLTIAKNTNHANGVSATDMIQLRNHILDLDPIVDAIRAKAGDVNGNGSITATDLILVRNIILELETEFPDQESWGFEPQTMRLSELLSVQGLESIGYKVGDLNQSADPDN